MAVGCVTHVGNVRKNNEDSFYIDQQERLLIVADGMGGHENGQVASGLAVQVFCREAEGLPTRALTMDKLQEMVDLANSAVHRYQEEVTGKLMGTTFTAAVVDDRQLRIVHIGDSRAYAIRDEEIIQLTEDHSYLAELARLGQLDQDDLDNSRKKNVLIKALGPEAQVEAQCLETTLEMDQTLLLCTDGLHNLVTDQEMLALVSGAESLQLAAERLAGLALERGGTDNITVVLYRRQWLNNAG